MNALHTSLLSVEVRLAFLGGVTIYQDGRKFDATATLFAEGHPPDHSWFGHFDFATPDGIASGVAVIHFSDGSEAEAAVGAVDADRGGFRLTNELRELRPSS